jgi:hypothetical protein
MANPVQINDGLHVEAVAGVGKTTAQEARTSQSAFVAHDGAGAVLGVFYEGTQTLITGTATTAPSMQVSVSPLAFCGQKASTEGVYIGRSVGTVLVDVAAAPGSNSRIDTVYVMQRDLNSNTSPDGLTQGEIGVVTGTPGVSPTAPAAPAGAVVIGTVQVAAGVTATTNAGCTITTTCRWTTGAGAPLPVRNVTERGALTAYAGLRVIRLDLGSATELYAGGAWTYGHKTAGFAATTPTYDGTVLFRDVTVDITAAGFTAAPAVAVGLSGGPSFASTAPAATGWVTSVSSTSVIVRVKTSSALANGSTVGVYIICSGY